MKIKKKPGKKTLDTMSLADTLGFDYDAARERSKTASDRQKQLSEEIKIVAKEVGERTGDRCIIQGATFMVGVLTTKPSQRVDWDAFRKQQPQLWQTLVSQQVDEKLVEAAIQSGALPRKLLTKFLVVDKPPQERVIVERLGQSNNENP